MRAAESTHFKSAGVLVSGSAGTSFGPRNAVGHYVHTEVILPPLEYVVLEDVSMSPEGSAVSTGSEVVIWNGAVGRDPSHSSRGGLLVEEGPRLAVVRNRPWQQIERGISFCALGSFNWYHWLVEILPRSMLLEELPNELRHLPLIVPDAIDTVPQFREAFDLACGNRAYVPLRRDQTYRVAELVLLGAPVWSPFDTTGRWPVVGDHYVHASILRSFSEKLLGQLPNSAEAHESPKRVVLARSQARRAYNQHELIESLVDLDFEVVFPEELSFARQAEVFRNADILVGPTGAAWSNLLFAKRGSRAVCWMSASLSGFSCFSNLAALTGVDLRYVLTDQPARSSGDLYERNYELSVKDVRSLVESLL